MAQKNFKGILESVNLSGEPKRMNLNYNFFFRINRPTTIITEDGRVYHDLKLFNQGEGANSQRLFSFLMALQKKYGGEGFNEVYHKRLSE